MSSHTLHVLSTLFPPPRFLTMPTAGLDISTSGVKFVVLERGKPGLTIQSFGSYRFGKGVVEDGEILEGDTLRATLKRVREAYGIDFINGALPEQKSYLFELSVPYREDDRELEEAVRSVIVEEVPLPPAEIRFGFYRTRREGNKQRVSGVAYARRVVGEYRDAIAGSGLTLRALEGEMYALARALVPQGERATVLLVDLGKTTTKVSVIQGGVFPAFATTLSIGGHAITQAVQKHFGVTEDEAKILKRDKGLILEKEGEEYVTAMLTTVSALRDEIQRRFEYWQDRAKSEPSVQPIERVVLAGGNANVRGLPEYLMAALGVPVVMGNPFINLAPLTEVVPPIEYEQSLGYATAIGLALREYE